MKDKSNGVQTQLTHLKEQYIKVNTQNIQASEASLYINNDKIINNDKTNKNNNIKNTNHISVNKRKPKKILYPARLHINKKPNTRFYKESTGMAERSEPTNNNIDT